MELAGQLSQEMKKGDVVCLQSGGPPMTVEDTGSASSSRVKCIWFILTGEGIWTGPHNGSFVLEDLKLVKST